MSADSGTDNVVPMRPHARAPEPPLRTAIGQALREVRTAQRRTLSDVAEDAGVSMQYLSEIERGRKEASSEILQAVCGSLRIRLSDLLAQTHRVLTVGSRPMSARPPRGPVLMAA
ncbi:helix-turn-helix domain-containing protein [Actinopolymorpha pittospori]|uniref:DNA-binding XRE family transcriptional regulator n=1 Tax=Actinopolymorpha pittospori TaxID=648752 RepID=A0A927RCW3_9ACTN|nr:helix-turn-helix transcriptional regulator [Actinopolymorpha pittospori]MBE1611702.1 DNA-binding XRE family transcriptional regulator [Actinopolymorpha pittospori]